MTLTVSPVYDNPEIPGVVAFQYLPDQLIAGHKNLVSQPIVLAAGTLTRGAVLGQQTTFSITAAATAGNTGNGTVGSITAASGQEFGAYVLKATSATVFSVTDPEGTVLGNATVGTPYTSAELGFTITAGGTAFVAGDSFTLTSSVSVGNFISCVKTASDGSQTPNAILVDNADASAGPVRTAAYFAGEFNQRAILFDASWTLPGLVSAMRPFGMFLKDSISAADPS